VKTVGATGADYATLKLAFDDINSGVLTGSITLNIINSTTETASAVLNGSSLPANYTGVLITIPTGGAAATISGGASGISGALVDLNGADNVIIDGRIGQSGSTKSLTFENLNASGWTIRFINDATSNLVKYCVVKGKNNTGNTSSSAPSAGVILFSTTTGTSGNDNNTIDYCDIDCMSSAKAGIVSVGTSGATNGGLTISNSNIFDFYISNSSTAATYGLVFGSQTAGSTVSGCSFFQTASAGLNYSTTNPSAPHGAIFVNNANSGFSILNNYIGGSQALCGGNTWKVNGGAFRFFSIEFANNSTTVANSIQGNLIANFDIVSSFITNGSSIFLGMTLGTGSYNVGTETANTIGSGTATANILVNSSATAGGGSLIVGINASSTTGIYNISNNVIGGIKTTATTTSVFLNVYPINIANGTSTISSNKIGSLTTANSIENTSGSTQATTQFNIHCIRLAGGTNTVTGNTIANVTQNSISSKPTLDGIFAASGSISSYSGNTIRDLVSYSANTGTSSTASLVGIVATATTDQQNVTSNTIYNLSNLNSSNAAVNVYGVVYSGSTSFANTISRNFIHHLSVSSTNTAAGVYGIYVTAGTNSFINNMVSLGFRADGSSISDPNTLYGIHDFVGTSNYYFNSIYLGGTVNSGTTASFAFNSSVTTNTRNFRNNIFVNARSNSLTSTAKHYAVKVGGSGINPTGLTMSHNVYYAPGSGGVLGQYNSVDYTFMGAWQAANGQDLGSGYGDPNFVLPTGSSSTVDLHVQSPTPVESAGFDIVSVTTDFDGQTRSGLTPVDIGADAGAFTAVDIVAPSISYSALSNTASTSARTLSATITDASGVPTSGGGLPVLYWKINSGSYSASTGSYVSGNEYSFSFGSGVVVTDVVSYYIVAQDLATTPNLNISPAVGANGFSANPPAVSTAPTSPNSYTIVTGYSGTITVGTGGTFTTLTTASTGLFAAINAGVVSGNIIVSIVSDINETGATALNQWTEDGAGSYTLTIQSDGSARTLYATTSASNTYLLGFNGADRVTIDGGSSKLLTFRNSNSTSSSTGAVVQFFGGSTNCSLNNCFLQSNGTATTNGVIVIGTGTNSVSIYNNEIRDIPTGTGGATAGAYAYGLYSNTSTNSITVSGNHFFNFIQRGISFSAIADGAVVTRNSFYQSNPPSSVTGAGATNVYAIIFGTSTAGSGHNISNNYIGGTDSLCGGGTAYTLTSASQTWFGISCALGTSATSTIYNNVIQNIAFTGGGTYCSIIGINVSGGNVNIGNTVGTGNTIGHMSNAALGISGSGVSGGITAIYSSPGGGNTPIKYNNIGNITSSSTATNALLRGIQHAGNGSVDISNNTVISLTANAANTGITSSMPLIGIVSGAISTNQKIEQNVISGLSSNYALTNSVRIAGIIVTATSSGTGSVRRNRIYDLNNKSTATAGGWIYGIFMNSSYQFDIVNNQVAITNGSNTNGINIYGIYEAMSNSLYTDNYYYNSVYIGGSSSTQTLKTYAFYRGANLTINVKNNLFYNERSGTGTHFAVYDGFGTSCTYNNNVYIATNSNIGDYIGTAKTLSAWQTSFTPNQDAYSYADLSSSIPSANLFVSIATGNLNLKTTNAEAWIAAGKGVQITGAGTTDLDYDGNTRSTTVNGGPTCIGSHEILASGLPATPSATVTGSIAVTAAQNIIVYGKTVGTITWTSGTSLPSAIQVRYVTGKQHPDITSGNGSYAYWSITPTGGTDYNYSITLNYDPACLGLVNEALLKLAKWDGSGWVYFDGATSDITNKTVTVTGLSSFSDFVLTSSDNPLPVELVNFSAKAKSRNVNLTWETKTETDNSGFEIERKDKNGDWKKIGFVEGFGSSNSPKYYTFEDKKLSSGKHNYRLKQIDNDGTTSYSDEVEVTIDLPTEFALSQNYPNPFNPSTKVDYQLAMDAKVTIELYSITGERVATLLSQELEAGYYSMMIDSYTHGMASGIYIYRMIATDALGKSFVSTKKLSLIK